MQADFYTVSLVTKLHQVRGGKLSLTLHYLKSFTKSLQDYTFQN